MENAMLMADAIMEYIVLPAEKTTQPAPWVGLLRRAIQFLKVALLCCQVLAWLGVL